MRFFIAWQFLTIIPVRIRKRFGERELAQSMFFFPFVGIAIGLALAGTYEAASLVFSGQVTSILVVMVLAVITGGLHLDGLADTADALFSSKSKEEKLRIMKSSHIGAMGAAAVTLILLLKVALLDSVPEKVAIPALVLFPAAGRCGLLLPALFFDYAREEGGTGAAFVSNLSVITVLPAVILTGLVAAVLLQLAGVCALAVACGVTVLAGKLIASKIDGMTGDTLGAINEASEIAFLAAVCAAARYGLLAPMP